MNKYMLNTSESKRGYDDLGMLETITVNRRLVLDCVSITVDSEDFYRLFYFITGERFNVPIEKVSVADVDSPNLVYKGKYTINQLGKVIAKELDTVIEIGFRDKKNTGLNLDGYHICTKDGEVWVGDDCMH